MGVVVTDLDLQIAERLRKFRAEAKLTQPQVAEYLGIQYQSYQRMEAGKHSFRASTLDRMAMLYNMKLFHFISGGEAQVDPLITKACLILHGMSDDDREAAIRALLNIKHNSARGTK